MRTQGISLKERLRACKVTFTVAKKDAVSS